MKIIKKGTKTLPEEIVYITKCRICGCVFTYEEKDMNYINNDGLRGVACPQCSYCQFSVIKRKYKGDDK